MSQLLRAPEAAERMGISTFDLLMMIERGEIEPVWIDAADGGLRVEGESKTWAPIRPQV